MRSAGCRLVTPASCNPPCGHLQGRVDRQKDVADPVHDAGYRSPNQVRVVPGALRSESLEGTQESRGHETHEPAVHRIRVLLAFGELDDRDGHEQARQCGQDHVAAPVGQVENAVVERHIRSTSKPPWPAPTSRSP